MKTIRRITISFSFLLIFFVALLVGYHYYSESDLDIKLFADEKDEIVRYIMPADIIEAQPEEKVIVNIIAQSEAEITVKLGTKKFPAKCEKDAEGFAAFKAEITMPDSEIEVDSLGKITVIAVMGETAIQLQGPKIVCQKEIQTVVPTTAPSRDDLSTGLNIKNYVSQIQNDAYGSVGIAKPTEPPSTTYNYVPYSGNQMCIVTGDYPDTKPISSEDNFVPYFTPLPAGTIDYVTGESEGYDVDENETEYYYNLASGRKVKREYVQLVTRQDMGDNSLNVISSLCTDGKMKITLSAKWKVPYDISYTPQDYYYAGEKYYNVASFTASTVEFTFHYTTSAFGEIDTSGSDVISSAHWSVNESNKTAKLTLSLKNAGNYYGSSVEYDSAGNIVITVNRKPIGAAGAVVVLDPGHGGKDPGAVGLNSQVWESHVNLLVAYATMQELQSRGVTVYLTQADDSEIELDQRKAATRSVKPDLFVSIHSNASTDSSSIGTSAYYFKPFSFELATNIYNNLLSVHRNYFYAGRQDLYGDLADGVHYYPFSVTRIEDCPSVLVEMGFLTNDEECYKLADSNNQKLLGKAIADGIIETLS